MNTIAKSTHAAVKTQAAKTTQPSDFWKKAEEARFGIVPIILLIVGCMGGIAAAFGSNYETSELAAVAVPTMLTLSFMLAVGPMRLIVWSSIIALLFDLAVLIF